MKRRFSPAQCWGISVRPKTRWSCRNSLHRSGSPRRLAHGANCKIYREYVCRLREANALDFDDIILHAVTLLQQFDEVRHYYQRKFRYVLIDEYQDTNNLQYLPLLAPGWGTEQYLRRETTTRVFTASAAPISKNILSFEKGLSQGHPAGAELSLHPADSGGVQCSDPP